MTRATVPPGRAQIIKPNVFSIFQTDSNLYIMKNALLLFQNLPNFAMR
jgi:hypothetical protein